MHTECRSRCEINKTIQDAGNKIKCSERQVIIAFNDEHEVYYIRMRNVYNY